MSFVEEESVIVATYLQNALHQVKPGDHAELTLNYYPGRIFKAKVHSIVRSTGAGQLPLSGVIPQSLPQVGEGRLVVRFELEGEDANVTVPGGTHGTRGHLHGAPQTDRDRAEGHPALRGEVRLHRVRDAPARWALTHDMAATHRSSSVRWLRCAL